MYDHKKQYRCTIIRGKSQKEIDDLLPAYAKIVIDICPCPKEQFEIKFNDALAKYIPTTATKKTLDNHRTEIVGKLFGMYYAAPYGDDETYIYPSERTMKFLEDNDQPAFFKDVCYKMQFPNGMSKLNNTIEYQKLRISIRPNSYVLKILVLAENAGIRLSKNDIGYYILNSMDVLTRTATPSEVIKQIKKDKEKGIIRTVHADGKALSYDMQHINEQINYLELANVIIVDSERNVMLNENDMETVMLFADSWDKIPDFDVSKYDLDDPVQKKQFHLDWDYYFSKLSSVSGQFETTIASLGITKKESDKKKYHGSNKIELGDEGENYVFEYEKNRVRCFNARLANKVVHLGKTRGLGYDIQSVIAEKGDMSEFVKYIEVKSTRRVTEPDFKNETWIDTLNITRNEWIAAMQHKDFYSIFRVYFVRGNVIMYIIKNIYQKEQEDKIKVIPTTYRVDFGRDSVDEVITQKNGDVNV